MHFSLYKQTYHKLWHKANIAAQDENFDFILFKMQLPLSLPEHREQ